LKDPAALMEKAMSIAQNPNFARDLETGKKIVTEIANFDFKQMAQNFAKYGLNPPKNSKAK
jgi:hypothetical protein